MLIIGFSAHAQGAEVPKHLKDSTITVTLKDGKTYKFSNNEYMVVLRKPKVAPKVEPKVEPKQDIAEQKPIEESKPPIIIEQKKNRVRLLGGVGPTGKLKVERNSNDVTIGSRDGILGGLGYDRMLDHNKSLGGQAFSNGTFVFGIGLDF